MSDTAGIFARDFGYLDCAVQIGVAQGRVISLDFTSTVEPDAEEEHELLDRIDAYLEGSDDDFGDVTVAMTMQTEHATVLESVREIPYGEDITVEQLSRMVPGIDGEDDQDRTTVREALAANPVPLFVPDHRVRDGPSGAPPDVEQKLRSLEGL